MSHILKRLRADAYVIPLGELLEQRDEAAREIERLQRELARRASEPQQGRRSPPIVVEQVRRTESHLQPSLLRLSDVCELVSLSRSSIYAAVAIGRFPRPVKVGTRSVRWRIEEVRSWIESSLIDGSKKGRAR